MRLGLAVIGAIVLPLQLSSVLQTAKAEPPDERLKTVQGTVERLTTAPKGETDGAVLDDGTAVHWPPHLGNKIGGIVTKGDRVQATGRMKTTPRGDTHLEVESIKDLATNASFDQPDGPPAVPHCATPEKRRQNQPMKS